MPNGQGMLSRAAQAAAQVPPPGGAPGGAPAGPPAEQPAMPVPPGTPAAAPQAGQLGLPQGPDTVQPGAPVPGVETQGMPGEGAAYQGEDVTMGEEEATPREQAEYERTIRAMERVLYEEDRLADAIVKQIDPNNKIDTTTKATALLIQQLDEKIDIDEVVIPQVTMDAVEEVSELAENRYGMQFSEQELQATVGATWEAVMAIFGVDEGDYNTMTQTLGPEAVNQLRTSYDGFLNQSVPGQTPPLAAPTPVGSPAGAPPGSPQGPPAAPPVAPAGAPPGAPPGAAGPPVPMPPGGGPISG